jgi:hypothetical protein
MKKIELLFGLDNKGQRFYKDTDNMNRRGEVTIHDQGFYICECGYEKQIKGGENARNGLELVKRLHRKSCAVACRGHGPGTNYYEQKSRTHFKDSEERKAIGAHLDECRRTIGQIKDDESNDEFYATASDKQLDECIAWACKTQLLVLNKQQLSAVLEKVKKIKEKTITRKEKIELMKIFSGDE